MPAIEAALKYFSANEVQAVRSTYTRVQQRYPAGISEASKALEDAIAELDITLNVKVAEEMPPPPPEPEPPEEYVPPDIVP